jgi:predicted RNase H-like HicB family nuclease
MKRVGLSRYIKEALRNADYRKGSDFDCVVAFVPDFPGCITQGEDFEEARENLVDAIELWVTMALRDGEGLPPVNGCILSTCAPVAGRPRTRELVHA